MELLQLRYFQEVARRESMTQAAQALHVAQPSLSKTIARLEEQVGAPLFDRRGRRIELNDGGRRFLARVDRCLRELEDGVREVRDLAEQSEGSVAVGAATARMLPGLVQAYLTRWPGARLRLTQVTQHDELLRQLERGTIDLSISALPLRQEGICCEPVTQERICLVVPPWHRLAARGPIRLAELGAEPLIHHTAECGLRGIIEDRCAQEGFVPNVVCECTTPEVACGLVEAGLGLAFLPEYLKARPDLGRLVWRPIGVPELRRTIWLSWREERYLSRAARAFRALVRERLGPGAIAPCAPPPRDGILSPEGSSEERS